jgi:hypothetical protein
LYSGNIPVHQVLLPNFFPFILAKINPVAKTLENSHQQLWQKFT